MSKTMRLVMMISGVLWGMGVAEAFDMASPPDSLVVDLTGNIGVGTAAPNAPLHVVSEEDAMVKVENTSATSAQRVMFKLINNGRVRFSMVNGDYKWTFNNNGTDFTISFVGSGLSEFKVDQTGNLTILGALTENSSRASKRDIAKVDAKEVLGKVMALPISEWSYKRDASVRHLGPMAEDFHLAFGLGADDKGIATIDTSGVALAAIQALKAEKDAQLDGLKAENDAKLDALRAENQSLKAELTELKRLVYGLVSQDKVALVY